MPSLLIYFNHLELAVIPHLGLVKTFLSISQTNFVLIIHYNVMVPLSYMWSSVSLIERSFIMQHMNVFQATQTETVKILTRICQQIWKTEQWPTDWKHSIYCIFFSITIYSPYTPPAGKHHTIVHSHKSLYLFFFSSLAKSLTRRHQNTRGCLNNYGVLGTTEGSIFYNCSEINRKVIGNSQP